MGPMWPPFGAPPIYPPIPLRGWTVNLGDEMRDLAYRVTGRSDLYA